MNNQQSGQGTVELILLMVVMIAIVKFSTQYMKKTEFLKQITSGPWAAMDGMIQCGVWKPCGLKNPSSFHPSSGERVLSAKPQ